MLAEANDGQRDERDDDGGRECLVYLRPGISVQADRGIELLPIEFGRGHCTLRAKRPPGGGRIAKQRVGRLFILTLQGATGDTETLTT